MPVRVDGVEILVEAVPVTGTEPTSGKVSKATGSVLDAFGRAQEAIIAVARSTAKMIDSAGAAARPDRVEVAFGLKFSASGGVIMAGASGEASLMVTLSYDVAGRGASGHPAGELPESAPAPEHQPTSAGVVQEVPAASRVPS
jgi:hypothetical protein